MSFVVRSYRGRGDASRLLLGYRQPRVQLSAHLFFIGDAMPIPPCIGRGTESIKASERATADVRRDFRESPSWFRNPLNPQNDGACRRIDRQDLAR